MYIDVNRLAAAHESCTARTSNSIAAACHVCIYAYVYMYVYIYINMEIAWLTRMNAALPAQTRVLLP